MGLFWRIHYTSVRSTGGKIFEYFLNIMQGDSDLWLHSLCVSTVQTAQSHQSRFYHKSSLPDFHANTTHLTAVLIIYNMFHVLFYSYSQLRIKLFSFHWTRKNQPSKGLLFVVELSRLRLSLFFLHFIFWLKFIWNHQEAALGLNLEFLVHFICFPVFPFHSVKCLIQSPN